MPTNQIISLELGKIVPSKTNPRKDFDQKSLQELAASIKQNGLREPILVRKVGNKYEIVDGERRFRAYKILKLNKIVARVDKIDDKDVRTIQLITFLHKENLNPIEEANYMQQMMDELELSRDQIAQKTGKSPEYVAKRLALAKLIDPFRIMLNDNILNLHQAISLARLQATAQRLEKAKEADENVVLLHDRYGSNKSLEKKHGERVFGWNEVETDSVKGKKTVKGIYVDGPDKGKVVQVVVTAKESKPEKEEKPKTPSAADKLKEINEKIAEKRREELGNWIADEVCNKMGENIEPHLIHELLSADPDETPLNEIYDTDYLCDGGAKRDEFNQSLKELSQKEKIRLLNMSFVLSVYRDSVHSDRFKKAWKSILNLHNIDIAYITKSVNEKHPVLKKLPKETPADSPNESSPEAVDKNKENVMDVHQQDHGLEPEENK